MLKIKVKRTKKWKHPEIVHATFLRAVQLLFKFDLYFISEFILTARHVVMHLQTLSTSKEAQTEPDRCHWGCSSCLAHPGCTEVDPGSWRCKRNKPWLLQLRKLRVYVFCHAHIWEFSSLRLEWAKRTLGKSMLYKHWEDSNIALTLSLLSSRELPDI